MDAKLIKTTSNYFVLNDEFGNLILQNLSLKNCQAIERGYDLDELVKEQYPIDESSFKRGFKLALEILGDKKFSEEDIINAHSVGRNYQRNAEKDCHITPYLNSLQQTEWDVEIVMDICGDKVYAVPEPKLDADGCIILKRK